MCAVFGSQNAAVLKLCAEGVEQTFLTANWRSKLELFAVARNSNLLFLFLNVFWVRF